MVVGIWQYEYTGTMFTLCWLIYALIPMLDYLSPLDLKNRTPEEYEALEKDRRYLIPLYIIWVLDYYSLYWSFNIIYYQGDQMSWLEYFIFIATLATGAGIGATVGHELFHRRETVHKIFGTSFYFKMLNMNFLVEHLQGHHKNVATPIDPASADKGQDVYSFAVKSIYRSFTDGWGIEARRVGKAHPKASSLEKLARNKVFQLKVIEYLMLCGIYYVWGLKVLTFFLVMAYTESFLLETINYIEHYGLRRKEIAPGKYERTTIRHSWNAAHRWTNCLLVKLQRHSDHHENGFKPYQTLCTYENAPQLPHGYSLMILFSLCPPLFMRVMDPIVDAYQNHNHPPSKEQLEYADKLVRRGLFSFFAVFTFLFGLYFI